jgi:hypothetical protein
MKNPTMLYKHPGPYEIHGDHFDYIIVDDSDIDSAIADGWALKTTEALSTVEVPSGKKEKKVKLIPQDVIEDVLD